MDVLKAALERCRGIAAIRTAIVHPVKGNVIEAAADARARGLIEPVLIGPLAKVEAAALEAGVDISGWEQVDAEHSHAAAETGARMAAGKHVAAIMKGSLHTDELLGAVVHRDSGLRTGRRLSHAYVMATTTYPIDRDAVAKALMAAP